jgi:hypothetical protein
MEKRLNEHEAAKVLGRPVGTLRQWRHLNRGPAYHKQMGHVFYIEKDLIDFTMGNRIDPAAIRAQQQAAEGQPVELH